MRSLRVSQHDGVNGTIGSTLIFLGPGEGLVILFFFPSILRKMLSNWPASYIVSASCFGAEKDVNSLRQDR